jgi:phage gp45-like
MHRATPANTSFRAYSAGGARAIVSSIDDNKLMKEMGGNFMKSESRTKIESPQNYGWSSVTFDPDQEQSGGQGGGSGPETFISFMGGNRSFPVAGPIDDRRHRLKGLDKGDVGMFRGKDDAQQFLLLEKGNFMSMREDKKFRFALVPDKREQQSSGGQQGQQKGQKSTYDENEKSETFYEMKKEHHKAGAAQGHYTIDVGKNTQFQASKHIRKGETHRDSQMFVNGNVHAADHIAGGGTSITSSDDWTATGRPGTTSLLQTAAKVVTMGSMMSSISSIFRLVQQGQSQEADEMMQQLEQQLAQLQSQ